MLALALAVGCSFASAQTDPDAAVERYLEEHGLKTLLAEHLAERLRATPPQERGPIAERLAAIFVGLLEAETDEQRRGEWERRARELIELAPEAQSLALRLSLDQARYIQAERTLERARLKLEDERARIAALRTMESLAPIFAHLGDEAHRQVLALQRQEEADRSADPELIARALREARRTRSLGMYLAGWSNSYLAEMGGQLGRARDAIVRFGWLLGAELSQPPELGRVRDTTLRLEHVARAAIGVAIAHASLGDDHAALDWLDMVERSSQTPESVRSQILARRITILARLNRWSELGEVLHRSRRPLSPALARLVMVVAMESDDESSVRARQALAREALADLVARQELAHVVDLASRYGASMLGTIGFIARHVRALLVYDAAREAHRANSREADAPTSDAEVAAAYGRAASLFAAALDAADAAQHREARASAAMLLGMSLYYGAGDRPLSAARNAVDAFERASELATDHERSADALWMAHRAARRAAELSGDHALERRAAEVAGAFVERFPEDERAGVLRVRHAASGALSREDSVSILLDTPRSSPAWEASRRHAARLLYESFRTASPQRRDWAALRYADVAEPLLAIDRARAGDGDVEAAELVAARARRLLDALLSVVSPDAERAQAALDALLSVRSNRTLRNDAPDLEVDLRRAQIALAAGDDGRAMDIIASMRRRATGDSDGVYLLSVMQDAFNRAVRAWRRVSGDEASEDERVNAARLVVERGVQLILDSESHSDEPGGARRLALTAALAHASYDLWRADGDADAQRLSIRQHQRLLAERPGDRSALRRLAELAEAAGDIDTALSCWRTLSAGLPQDSDDWFEARYRLIALLARRDPDRARAALEQHRALRPEWGPPAWRERFRELAAELELDASSPGAEGGGR